MFEPRSYRGKDYVTVLLEDFGITPDDAIKHVRNLSNHLWVNDEMPNYRSSEAYVFKKLINNVEAYIKLKIEEKQNEEILVVISFHKDYR